MTNEKIQRATVRAVLDLFQEEAANFHYNEPNNYGYIHLTLSTGEGDARRFMGEETQAVYYNGRRGTGCFKLNDALVEVVLAQIEGRIGNEEN